MRSMGRSPGEVYGEQESVAALAAVKSDFLEIRLATVHVLALADAANPAGKDGVSVCPLSGSRSAWPLWGTTISPGKKRLRNSVTAMGHTLPKAPGRQPWPRQPPGA